MPDGGRGRELLPQGMHANEPLPGGTAVPLMHGTHAVVDAVRLALKVPGGQSIQPVTDPVAASTPVAWEPLPHTARVHAAACGAVQGGSACMLTARLLKVPAC